MYSFTLPAACDPRCGAAYTKVSYTTSNGSTPAPTPAPTPTPTPTPTQTATPTPTGGTGVSCGVTYQVANAWQGGFTADVTVRNTGTTTWNNWALTWTAPAGVTLTNAWNSTITPSGGTWTVKAPSWATSLAPGASAAFGFQAGGPSTPGPSGITCT
ncbi:cellulose binding domain-containing protein [Nonomuraea roseoviolacea]|uniref:CBM2 domain-containing protein n=1 Tax=Nonomuraea roseoviolacea subsp. carminata TaxID=160689 RepID=A0ABT1K6W8_9ACTN|nr:cellulose binding domain-containing protein [Nonomuraea roseoviolacea]MCP2349342.1 hypothetical protein [Nonomuraea roseoviolacea subsp. carminata]